MTSKGNERLGRGAIQVQRQIYVKCLRISTPIYPLGTIQN